MSAMLQQLGASKIFSTNALTKSSAPRPMRHMVCFSGGRFLVLEDPRSNLFRLS